MRVIFCTTPLDQADALAEGLVEARVAACVNIVPTVRSIYRWKGAVEKDDEALLLIKTTAEGVPAVLDFIDTHHPYDVPEAIALPIQEGLPDYLAWLEGEVATRR